MRKRQLQRQEKKQIPFGNDNQKGKCKGNGNGKSNSRFPSGMTTKKTKKKANAKTRGLLAEEFVFGFSEAVETAPD